ncbi:DUF1611 domain-containing protein [Anaerosporobacter faecicola]|uniref:DUF1611 domain-containing protein n=1 Tax=Anaerosporobacter faecicola TaxID=2718714 RepID=UPI00143A299D|nr:DUF1611 domain-containing protein [Anaerosporobacter faecicola]
MINVALYPFDKITRGLVKFKDLLNFNIYSIVDFVYNIGEDAGANIDGNVLGIPILDDIKKALEHVDLLIINSMNGPFINDTYKKIYKEHRVEERCKEMLDYAAKNGISIVCTHDLDEKTNQWLMQKEIDISTYHKSDEEMESFIEAYRNYESLGNTHKIAIYATNCCLGKYTTQLYALRALKAKGKKVAALITEPVAPLYDQFDADPIRHRLLENPMRYVHYVKSLMKQIEQKGYSYMIYADQQSITGQYFLEEAAANISLLKAYDPDTIFLVVGYDNTNLQNCLDLIRIYCNGKKPTCILLPDCIEVTYGVYETKTPEEIQKRIQELKETFHMEQVVLIRDIEGVLAKF